MNDKRMYYWIVAKDPDTDRPYLISATTCKTEDEARQKGLEMLGGMDFVIKRYPTRDLDAASAYLRGKRLEGSHSLKEATKRIGHEKSVKRRTQRKTGNYPFY